MTAFYNEPDPYAAQWLRNLIAAGHIAPGVVDERPIQEIEAWELAGFTQCHFFAGIGIWSHALRRAGWPDDLPIWTGSCPCQPFSAAGQRKGISDERHLWPTWFNLIEQCKPPIVVGEQVASKDGLGWLDLVSTDMESADYSFGTSDLCAAGFGEAHLRQRLYFVGMANANGRQRTGFTNSGKRFGNGKRSDGSKATVALPMIAQLTGWATPAAQEPGGSPEAHLARKQKAKSRGVQMGTEAVTHVALQAQLTGWNTPTAPVNTNGHQAGNNRYVSSVTRPCKDQQFAIRGKLTNDGWMQIGFCVEILPENQVGGPLNPEHSRWLMGLPPEWSSCAPTETLSTRKRQPRLSKPLKKFSMEYDL